MGQFTKYRLLTYGCQMNQYDSEVIASFLESLGAVAVDSDDEADVIIMNTCCVRNSAEDKVYGRLGQYKALKGKNPDLVLVVMGCLAQKDKDELIRRYPHVNLVIGTHNIKELPVLLGQLNNGSHEVLADDSGAAFLYPENRKSGVTGYITISIGCDCFCTFCIVPYVRGRIKSKPIEQVEKEAEMLVKEGFGEIFLLGQNVNTYGYDLPGKPTFTELLKRLNQIPGIRRIRFTSPHPRDFSDQLITELGRLEHVCPSVHLPLQAGSDGVLKRMNRRYDTARYEYIVEGLRKSIKGLALSTDLIVGFPGETDQEFEEGLDFIRKIQFDQAYMFAYSRRSGTAADKMPDQVPHDVKMARLYRLIKMQNDITLTKNRELQGSIEEALAEGISRKDPSRVTGRTGTNKVVNFPGDASLINTYVKVRLDRAYTWGFVGSQVPGNL